MKTRWLNILVLLALVLGTLPFAAPTAPVAAATPVEPTAAAPDRQVPDEPLTLPRDRAPNDKGLQFEPVEAGDVVVHQRTATRGEVLYEQKDAVGPATYIIQLEAEPLATYQGGISGLPATSPAVTSDNKLDIESRASRDYRSFLAEDRNETLAQIRQEIGRVVKVIHVYETVYNGMAVEMTPDEAAKVALLPGVVRVIRNYTRYLQTDTTPDFLNAWGIWDGTNTGGVAGTMGEGVIVGIIDTGINMDHPSFAATGDDGYTHNNPWGAGNYTGWCDGSHPSYDDTLVCNDKLIGVYSYPSSGNNPEDDNSHGSHTASTSAGNILYDVEYDGYTFDVISGMAPHANIVAFDVCTSSGCQGDSILAAINDAVADGVDVINYSIGGGPQNPWEDPDSEAYLNARNAGVFVATSAGNDGPGAGTLGSPANSPWITSVGNTTIGRIIANTADVTGPGTVPAELQNLGAVRGPEGPAIATDIAAAIIYAGDVAAGNIEGCAAFPAGAFTASIALIQRGTCDFAVKVNNAAAAGAVAVVVFNHSGGPPMVMGGLAGATIPSVFISLADGEAVRDWVQAEADPTMRINAGVARVVNPDWADIMNAGSSRGPNVNANVIKPDIAAPGTNIFAAYAGDASSFGMMSGTSMASPHVAGAGALLSALKPGWTPAEMQSALMMTSKEGLVKEDATTPIDPFDGGAGRLDLTYAALAGLVLDESTANYEAADPALGGDPTTLNLASLANADCLLTCAWERVFSNTTGAMVTWEVTLSGDVPMAISPISFTIAAGATQMVEFTADVTGKTDGTWLFGTVTLTADDPALPVQHLPVAVMPSSGVLPDVVEVNTRRNAGSQMIEDLEAVEIFTMTIETFGLVQASLYDFSLYQDPTNGDPYDDTSQVHLEFATVPVGTKRLVAEVTASEASDVDLFVLYDTGGGNYEEVCAGATPSWDEYCDLTDPDAGNYLIIVQNWQGTDDQPDAITLAVGVVPGTDAGNMDIEGPDSVPMMEPFDLQLFWDTPTMVAGDRWYGAFSLGTEPGSEGDIGTIPVDIVRHGDDVVKTASSDFALFGETLTYIIAVQPNITPEDLTYVLTDTIPAGLTYIPGSASATDGVVDVTGTTLTWTGTMYVPTAEYMMSTSLVDPLCAAPMANSGAYLDLTAFGVMPQSAIQGDTLWFSTFATGDPFTYWGNAYTGMHFTDDGFAFFGSTPGTTPWVNEDIPNPDDPNNLMAMFWNDWEVVYTSTVPTRGVSLATLGGATGGGIIDFSGMQPYGDDTQTIDFQVFAWRTPDPALGDPDIVFAYDNIALDEPITVGTIGIENALGTDGIKYAYDDVALQTLQDGMAICFDWFVPLTDPVLITYQVTVDEDGAESPLTNTVIHEVDNAGSLPAETEFDLFVLGDAVKDVTATLIDPGELVTYTIVLTGSAAASWDLYDPLPDGLDFVSVDGADYDPGTHSISWSGLLGTGMAAILQDFEGDFPPAGWSLYTASGGDWVRSSSRAYSGTYSAFHDDTSGAQDAWLITPQFAGGGTLSFWQNENFSDWYGYHGIWVSTATDAPADFTELVELGPGTEDTWEEVIVDLSAYAGQAIYLAFRYQGNYSDEWYVDDVLVETPVANPAHTITVVLEGYLPGYYTNVAHFETQGFHTSVEAPELRVFGPTPTWEKEIWINGDGPLNAMNYVVPGDMVTIVDRVSVESADPITFTLVEAWDALVTLQAYEADFGDVTPDTAMLTWEVEGGVADTWYTLTKTFEVFEDFGWSGAITETLTVEGYGADLTQAAYLVIPALLDKDGPSEADTGELITYTLTIETEDPIVSFMELADPLPAGTEFVPDSLQASYGTAWYDASDNTVYWHNAVGNAYNTQQAEAIRERNLAATTKQADLTADASAPTSQSEITLDLVTLLEEGFEGGVMPPAGWSVIDASSRNWELVDSPAWVHTGTYAGWVNYVAQDQDEWLISPLIDFAGTFTPTAEFWVYANNNWVAYGELQFLVIDGGGVFTDTLWQQSAEAWPYPSTYHQVVVDLSDYEDQSVYLAWRYVGNDGDSIALDDIRVMGEVEPPPSEVSITFNAIVTGSALDVTINSATLSYMGTEQHATTCLKVNGYTLDVNIVGEGDVDIDPDLTLYSYGDVATLTATADSGWAFAGWSGDTAGTSEEITLTIAGDTAITATFEMEAYTLDVTTVGGGAIAVDPDNAVYTYGDVVTLTATADTGWAFIGWSGDETGTDAELVITILSDTAITATFEAIPYTLDVTIVGGGAVAVDPDNAVYTYGDVVTLTATADTGWAFSGWSGDETGTDAELVITIMEDTAITATFLTVSDLVITKEVAPAVDLDLGDVVTYTITLVNTGDLTAAGITLTDTLPAGVVFESFITNADGVVEDDGVLTWSGALAKDELLTVVFTATVADDDSLYGQDVTNTVTFTAAAGNGTAEATFTLKPLYRVFLPLTINH